MSDSFEIVVILLAVFIIIVLFLIVVGAVAAILGRKKLQRALYRYLKPDPTTVRQDWERLVRRFPNLGPDEVAAIYVKEESRFLAWVGVLTIIPILGFVVDVSFTTLRQMRMLHVITALYHNDRLDPEKLEMQYMGIVGGANLVVRSILIIIASEIPFLNAIINALFNWFFTNQVGKAGIGLNKEQSLWQTARHETEMMKGRIIGPRNTPVGAIDYRSQQQVLTPGSWPANQTRSD